MNEGMYNHLIKVSFVNQGSAETKAKIAEIENAVGTMVKKTPPLSAQFKSLSNSMKELGLNENQIKNVFTSMQQGANITKLTANQVNLLQTSLAKAGATQPQINSLMKSLGTKGALPTQQVGDLERALKRAAIVAPVWLILRNSMMSFLRGFSEGFKYMEEFDAAMLKAQAVTHSTTGNIEEDMIDLSNRIRNLSQETGQSMTSIAKSFYQFGTIGIEFEKAWQGAEAATRFALATQEDSNNVAKTLAMTFKILGDTMDETIPPGQEMEVQLAKLYKLWQINAGEAGDLTASLAAFLPTANIANLTMDETIALLSTLNSAAMLGSKGGTLLRSSFNKLIENSDKLASSLGIYVNPELDTTFEVMMRVLKATKQLSEAQKFPIAAQGVISDIFGGIRGGEPIKALIALYDQLQQNMEISTASYENQSGALSDYNKRQQDVIGSVSNQLKLFRELRTQLFEQFITGVVGADDFAKGLEKINIILEQVSERALNWGEGIAGFFGMITHPILTVKEDLRQINKEIDDSWKQIEEGLAGNLSVADTIKLASKIKIGYPKDTYMLEIADRLLSKVQEMIKESKIQSNIEKQIIDFNEQVVQVKNKEVDAQADLIRQIELQKKDIQEQIVIQKLVNAGYSEADIIIAEIANEVSNIVNQYNSLDAVQNKIVPQLSKQEMLTNVLSENWDKILNLTSQQPFVQDKLLNLAKQVNQIELQKVQILQKQQEKYTDIYAKYEQSDAVERDRLKRMLELQNMTPDELVQAYQNQAYDKSLIFEYWSSFSSEGQNAIGQIIKQLYNLPEAKINATLTPSGALNQFVGIDKMNPPKSSQSPQESIANVTNYGAKEINLNVNVGDKRTPEEQAEAIVVELKGELIRDEEFQKTFSRKMINFLPGGN
jgi:TP901 family phage tail tape measure protein